MAKLIGSILILTSVLIISLYLYFKNQYQLQAIQEIKKALIIFYSLIEFSAMPLPHIFKEIADKSEGCGRELFDEMIRLLNYQKNTDINQMWCISTDKCSLLSSQDKAIIKGIGTVLGKLDKKLQLKNINLAIKALENKEAILTKKIEKNGGLYLRIGAMLGMLIIILFI